MLSIVKGYIFIFLQGGLLGHFWYFAALGFLYALLPFLGKIVHSRSNINFLWFCTAIVCVTIQVVSYMKGYPIQKNFPQALRVWTWVQYFLLGGVVSYNIEIVHKVSSKSIAKMILVILFVIIPVVEMNFGIKVLNVKYAEYFYDSFLNIIWNFLIFSVCISLKNMSAKCCVSKLALLTLGVYVIHFIFLSVIHHMWTISSSIQAAVLFASTSLISFTVTWMLYHSPISWFVKL